MMTAGEYLITACCGCWAVALVFAWSLCAMAARRAPRPEGCEDE